MNNHLFAWLAGNWIEIVGSVLGILYVYLSIKQSILTWLVGLLTSLLYIYVFFTSKFYADMSLQVYYVWISIYGWVLWTRKKETSGGQSILQVSTLSRKMFKKLLATGLLLWIVIYFVLLYFTDSPVPIGDSFTTAFSIVATFMLARKILEHWIIWVVVDFVSLLLYIWKGLYPTSVMFVVYTIAAIWGYFQWKKTMQKNNGLCTK